MRGYLLGEDVGAVGPGCVGQSLGHAAHAALDVAPRSFLLLQLPHHVVQQDVPDNTTGQVHV